MRITWPTNNSYQLNYRQLNFNFEDLFPASTPITPFNNFPWSAQKTADLISVLNRLQETFVQYELASVRGKARQTNEYAGYLMANNKKIEEVAQSIVDPHDSNDEKMYKIEQWVIENITYTSDVATHGQIEHWSTPDETLRTGQGDCEDGAFLIHSLALNAGVDSERLRTYGGLVAWKNEEGGLSSGGHGWTTYKKESDDEWVVLDWCFFVTDKPLNQRISMTDDSKYVDDYFFVNLKNTVDTPYSNGVRSPNEHVGYENSYKGNIVNFYA